MPWPPYRPSSAALHHGWAWAVIFDPLVDAHPLLLKHLATFEDIFQDKIPDVVSCALGLVRVSEASEGGELFALGHIPCFPVPCNPGPKPRPPPSWRSMPIIAAAGHGTTDCAANVFAREVPSPAGPIRPPDGVPQVHRSGRSSSSAAS
jgi:hypothetical protein